jgi:hypothetical protein
MPSARTSVGNKEYEYKGKKKRAAKSQRGAGRLVAGVFGDAADVGALRHGTDLKVGLPRVSTVGGETIFPRNKLGAPGRLDVQMSARRGTIIRWPGKKAGLTTAWGLFRRGGEGHLAGVESGIRSLPGMHHV